MLTQLTKMLLQATNIDINQEINNVDQFYRIIIFCHQFFCHTGRRGEIYGDKADKAK